MVDPDGRIPLIIVIPIVLATTSAATYLPYYYKWSSVLSKIDMRLIYISKKLHDADVSCEEAMIYLLEFKSLLKYRVDVVSKIAWATMNHEYSSLPSVYSD